MQVLKQSTADQVVYAYLCDATDGSTPEAGVTSPTVYLSKNGGAAAVPESLAWAETDGTNMPGWYELTLSAVDTDTVGPLGIDVYKSTVSRHFATVCYVSAALLDTIKAETALIVADTGTDGVLLAAAATSPALADAVWDEALSGHLTAGTAGKKLSDASAAANPWDTSPTVYATASDTFGYRIARILGGTGATASTITVQNNDDQPVEGVRVDAYTDATPSSATFYTFGDTDINGEVSLYLPTGHTWYLFRYRRGMAFSDPIILAL